jgi:hypothetical protein
LGLVGWIVRSVDISSVSRAIRTAETAQLCFGITVLLAAAASTVFRLRALVGPGLSIGECGRITVVNYFLSQVLPGGAIGGDAYRAIRLKRTSRSWPGVLTLITIERVIGASLILLPAIFLAIRAGVFEGRATSFSGVGLALEDRRAWIAGSIAIAALALLGVFAACHGTSRLTVWVQEVLTTAKDVSPQRYGIVFSLSALFHLLRLAGFLLLIDSLHSHIEVGEVVIVLALNVVASSLPISVGSLGVKEGTTVIGLAAFGVPTTTGLAVAVLDRLVLIFVGIVGGLVFWQDLRTPGTATPANAGREAE